MCCSAKQCDVVCCSAKQCDVVCCSAMQCGVVCCSHPASPQHTSLSACGAVAEVHIFARSARLLCYNQRCCSVLQCVAACCSVLQCVVVCCSVLQCVAVCCSVLQCAAVALRRNSALDCPCVAAVLMPFAMRALHDAQCTIKGVAVRCSMLQCVVVCYSVLQCAML